MCHFSSHRDLRETKCAMSRDLRQMALLLLVVAMCFCCAGCLQCLQCFDAKEDGPCKHNYMGLVNASLGLKDDYGYVKNCSERENFTESYCVIEMFYITGEVKSFMRDCSNGKTFSFSADNLKYPRLDFVQPNNFTTCTYQSSVNMHVCLQLCKGDFCNAPRPPPINVTCLNDTEGNSTCGATSLKFISGPLGPTIDRILGRAYLLPALIWLSLAMMSC